MIWIALLLAQASVPEIQGLVQKGDLATARTQLMTGLKKSPADPSLLNLLGVVEGSSGNYAGAESAFQKALSGKPDNVAILLNLARLYQQNEGIDSGAPAKAIQLYRRVLRIEPSHADARYQTAFLLMRQGNCDAALLERNKLSPTHQETPQALAIGAACESQPEKRAAITARLLDHARTRPADPLGILPAMEQQNHLDESRILLDRSVKRFGVTPELLTGLAKLSYTQKDYEAALRYLAHARDLAPSDPRIHFFFGMTAVAMNLVVEAKNALSEAVRLAPDNPYHHYALGAVLSEQRDAESAVPHFQKYSQLRPEDPRGRFGVAVAYFQSNQYDKAEPEFRKLTSIPETKAGAHYFLGRIAKARNQLDDAERELLLSLKLTPSNLDAEAELGQVYQRLRKDGMAEARLNRVLQANPQHYLANLTLLALYQRRKDPRAADQKQRVDQLQAKRQESEQALWRTIEYRPQ